MPRVEHNKSSSHNRNIGQFFDLSPPTITSSQQFLDPTTPPLAHNVTPSTSSLEKLNQAKAFVRNATGGGSVYRPDEWWIGQWNALWAATDAGMKVRNLQPDACSDEDKCFGLDPNGNCLCVGDNETGSVL